MLQRSEDKLFFHALAPPRIGSDLWEPEDVDLVSRALEQLIDTDPLAAHFLIYYFSDWYQFRAVASTFDKGLALAIEKKHDGLRFLVALCRPSEHPRVRPHTNAA